jgi:imidazolonepropionase-like amidohydrolase
MPLRTRSGLAVLLAMGVAARAFAQDAAPPAVVIENVTVIPMDSERTLPGHSVVVRGRRIAALGPSATITLPPGAQRIDGAGKFLIPGLAEMHGHFLGPQAIQQYGEAYADRLLYLFLANGVTTVRGMLGGPRDLMVREQIARGERVGPQVFVAGPSFNGNSAPNPDAGWRMVTEQRAAGYDLLKIHPGVPLDVFDEVVATARRERIPFAGHIPAAVGLRHALESRIATVEHLDGYVEALVKDGTKLPENTGFFGSTIIDQVDEAKIPALVATTKQSGAWNTPTQVLIENLFGDETADQLAQRPEVRYIPKATLEQWLQSVRQIRSAPEHTPERMRRFVAFRRGLIKSLHEATGRVLLGADTPQIFNVPGFATVRELELLVAAGLEPYDALVCGTRSPAEALGVPESFGTIAVGRRADLVLLEANPLQQIANVRRVAGVMAAGRWMPQAEIAKTLASDTGQTTN